MSLVVVVTGIALLTVPAITAHGSLAPPAQVRTACLAAGSGLSMLGIGAILTASPLVLRWHDGSDASRLGLTHLSPGGPWVWAAGAVGAGLVAGSIAGALRRTVRARRRAALPRWASESTTHDDCAGAELRVAPTSEVIAFAVPGRDPHVVVSRAVIRLPRAERRAVLAHEGAHLRLHHHRYLMVLATYERVWGWLPGARSVSADHRVSIEQWADVVAASAISEGQPALDRARVNLLASTHTSWVRTRPTPPATSPGWQLVTILTTVAVLIIAGAYSATHSVGDLGSALAALH